MGELATERLVNVRRYSITKFAATEYKMNLITTDFFLTTMNEKRRMRYNKLTMLLLFAQENNSSYRLACSNKNFIPYLN